jgi:hypothetical protein
MAAPFLDGLMMIHQYSPPPTPTARVLDYPNRSAPAQAVEYRDQPWSLGCHQLCRLHSGDIIEFL